MTLGRTSSGAIKIKTDEEGGGLRAVNCGCCGGDCACGSATPINPPGDSDFTKKLRGDPGVSPFTQVTVTYSITANHNKAVETMTGAWQSGDGLGCYGGDPLKVFVGDSCLFGFCGYCASNKYISSVTISLLSDGCLKAVLYDEIMFDSIRLAAEDCPENGGGSITIQGVAYPTVMMNDSGRLTSGTLDITFS